MFENFVKIGCLRLMSSGIYNPINNNNWKINYCNQENNMYLIVENIIKKVKYYYIFIIILYSNDNDVLIFSTSTLDKQYNKNKYYNMCYKNGIEVNWICQNLLIDPLIFFGHKFKYVSNSNLIG